MAFEGWASFGGTEILNQARTAAYAGRAGTAIGCTGCTDLADSLGDPPYTDPASDDAPWYDPALPESKDFHGLVGLEVTGADSTGQREATEYLGDGGVLGAPRYGSREIEFKVVAMAASREALSYGLGWLDTALQGSTCHQGCNGDTLCLYAACPERATNDGDPCGDEPTPDRRDWDPVAAGDRLVRQLFNVARTEGPTQDAIKHVGGAWLAELSFTLTAGKPWWWRLPRFVFDESIDPDYTDQVPNYDILGDPCPPPPDCLDGNPYCTGDNRPWPDEPFPGSSPFDPSLIDPCFPTSLFPARRAMWRVPSNAMAEWSATAPVVTLRSGKAPLRRVTLRWYTNPRNERPTGQLDPCDACAELTLPWVPERTTVTLDSRTHTVSVNCGGKGTVTSGTPVYGPWGGAYNWPVFDCATPLIAELVVLDSSWRPDVRYRVDLASRTGAV